VGVVTYGDGAYRLYAPEECTGRGGYPPVWHERIKHEVREAAENRCVRCGHPYVTGAGEWSSCDGACLHGGPLRRRGLGEEWVVVEKAVDLDGMEAPALVLVCLGNGIEVQAQWRILTVHHLSMVKGDLRWRNLVALCQRCHLTIQGKVQMARVWPWGHSSWFYPFAAAHYAAVYLGEELSREETMVRLDELLALERA
jgi:HNH endonuclease